jgi:hypothetical protein
LCYNSKKVLALYSKMLQYNFYSQQQFVLNCASTGICSKKPKQKQSSIVKFHVMKMENDDSFLYYYTKMSFSH